jgi:formylglycine-generating enzyme required for sulfatase activity
MLVQQHMVNRVVESAIPPPSRFKILLAGCLAVLSLAPIAFPQTAPMIGMEMSNNCARLSVTGEVGSVCTIQSVTNLSTIWQLVTNFTLTDDPVVIVDPSASAMPQRFYRAYTQHAPVIRLEMSNGCARLSVTGDAGTGCTIQCVTNLSMNWQFVTNFTFLTNRAIIVDRSPMATTRFYRVCSLVMPTNVVMSNMVWIPPGTFTMGSPATELERQPWEGPQTRVTISRGFWMGKFPVTQAEYSSLMNTNPSYFIGTNGGTDLSRPVETVDWYHALAYCDALTARESNAGRLPAGYVYRLPTEAEWEYACRAGTTTAFYYGPALRSGMANYNGRSGYDSTNGTFFDQQGIFLNRTTSVGSYAPNALGLYDMCGNVWEWCMDWYGNDLPSGTDPTGPDTGFNNVIRGGGWSSAAKICRAAYRYSKYPDDPYLGIGFRVVLGSPVPIPQPPPQEP